MTNGRFGARYRRIEFLLLTTTGRKSGKVRTRPLLYIEDADRFVVVGSNGGQDHHPAWYLNLLAGGPASVQVLGASHKVTATTATPSERERLWPRLVAAYKGYDTYVAKTTRQIPVVIIVKA
jgi:F420H(2)-dependent quinone reductase